MSALADLAWPRARAGEALAALAAASGLAPRAVDAGAPPTSDDALTAWLEDAGRWLGVEVEAVDAPYAEVDTLLGSGPALVAVVVDGAPAVIAVAAGQRGRLDVLEPSGRRARVPVARVRDALCAPRRAPVEADVDALVGRAGLDGRPRQRAVAAITDARLQAAPIGGVYTLRRPIEAAPRRLAADRHLGRRLAGTIGAFAIAHLLWIASWWAIGRGVLAGELDRGWLAAWALLVLSATAGRHAAGWLADRVAIDTGALLRRRLLAGTLRTDPDALRREGVGGALGRVLEVGSLDTLGVGGALGTAFGVIELVTAGAVIAAGAAGAILLALLVATAAVVTLTARRYLARRHAWSAQRTGLTHDLVEVMIGHQTRLAQLTGGLHDREDGALARYATAAAAMDRALWRLTLVPRAWPLVAIAGLVPSLLLGGVGAAPLAIALGGVLLAQRALAHLVDGAARLADFAIGWRLIAPLFRAGGAAPEVAPPGMAAAAPSPVAPVVTARGLGYRHAGRGQPVLADCAVVIERGAHLLLEGPSGAGKSTLGGILGGVRNPDTGLLLAGGVDRPSLGAAGWRRRVAYAPQFHDNHMFSAPLAFNLLLARGWPPSRADLALADGICRQLGLGDLLDRMPAGLFEMVGETGWQLSHGERSRIFLARALLQGADLVVLDESLAALDPETVAGVLACIRARAPASVIIAHP